MYRDTSAISLLGDINFLLCFNLNIHFYLGRLFGFFWYRNMNARILFTNVACLQDFGYPKLQLVTRVILLRLACSILLNVFFMNYSKTLGQIHPPLICQVLILEGYYKHALIPKKYYKHPLILEGAHIIYTYMHNYVFV